MISGRSYRTPCSLGVIDDIHIFLYTFFVFYLMIPLSSSSSPKPFVAYNSCLALAEFCRQSLPRSFFFMGGIRVPLLNHIRLFPSFPLFCPFVPWVRIRELCGWVRRFFGRRWSSNCRVSSIRRQSAFTTIFPPSLQGSEQRRCNNSLQQVNCI